jgi:Flp pilus assembly protein TadD
MTQLTIQQAFELALRQHQAGRLGEAEQIYRQILAREPNHAGALHNLGVIAFQARRKDAAEDFFRRAIALAPDYAEAHINLGSLLKEKERLEEAIHEFGLAISLDANLPEAHNNLGIALAAKGQIDEAIAAWREAVALRPDYAEAHNNLGNALIEKGQFNEAVAAFRQAIALRPNYAEAYNNLGNAMQNGGQLDQAMAAYRHAIGLSPNYAEPHNNLGNTLFLKREFDEAVVAYRRAIALNPKDAETHWNLARLLLLVGRFAEGWEEYEWRLRLRATRLDRDFPQPYWNGEDLPGQTLLIYSEGGFGDALNFIRLVPLVSERVGKVVVECQPELLRIFADIPVDQWIARGEKLPPFDCRISLPSLLRIFGIRLDNIPNSVPYLKAPRQEVEYWRGRIPKDGIKNIGLCWSGSRGELKERTRTLDVFAPLAKIAGVRFFSLQKGPEANQPPPRGMELTDHTQDLNDFADMAALIENLDLVISVDTSIAHLAGALAKPIWVLIPNHTDFRWLLDREDSPWYPTMRLFRQQIRGDWDSVIARVVNELSHRFKSPG